MKKVIAAISLMILASSASAGIITHSFDNGDDLSAWNADRSGPSGFAIANNELVMSIDGADSPNASGVFYDTQGMRLTFDDANFLSIDMYIDTDNWVDGVRTAGIWGIGYNNGSIAGWPILEYQGTGAVAASNPAGVATWDNLGWAADVSTLFVANEFNNLKLKIDSSGVNYLLNDVLIYQDTSGDVEYLSGVILNARNYGDSFTVKYDNLSYGMVPEPAMLALFGLGAAFVVRRKQK